MIRALDAFGRYVCSQRLGPILECGCGNSSTPFLHSVCQPSEHELHSVETDPAWMDAVKHLAAPWHIFHGVPEDQWDSFDLVDKSPWRWGLAFVDHKPGWRRFLEIRRLASVSTFVVVHDTEAHYGGVDEELAKFRFMRVYDYERPWTSVASNLLDPASVWDLRK